MLANTRILAVLFTFACGVLCENLPCRHRDFGADSVVCVCSSEYCDFLGDVSLGPEGTYTRITSSMDGLRFDVTTGSFDDTTSNASVVVQFDHKNEFQTIMGFGGAFTDATGISIDSLPEEAQELLLRSYFSPDGIEYNLCRVPIGGSDFSTRPYSYDDVEGDVELKHFNLTLEDYKFKLPYIRRAQEMTTKEFLLFGSPWSPPAWMKENGFFNGSGGLLKEMWQPWSDYFVKFVEQYEAEGAPLWGLTTQNEPLTGFEENYPWNTCAWSAEDQRDWLKGNLGPTLEAAGLRRLKLMIVDNSRNALPWYPATILDDPEAKKYVDGIAIHWYRDTVIGPSVMDETQDLFPGQFLLYTEACDGSYAPPGERVILGDWSRAQHYAMNIIEDLNHWSTGWVDWNMALDMEGGPNWASNFVDSPIIVNKETGEFYKQPMFYSLGHFSKFVAPGSRRIESSVNGSDTLIAAAFHNSAENSTVVVILNLSEVSENVSVEVGDDVHSIPFEMPAKSISTVLFPTPAESPQSEEENEVF